MPNVVILDGQQGGVEYSKLDGWQMNRVCTFVMFTQAPAYVVQSPLK